MSKILAWLFAFFYTPVPNKVIQPPEVETMSDVPVEIASDPATVTLHTSGDVTIEAPALSVTGTVQQEAAAAVKAGVADFEAALAFVESGVAQLGEAAKDELKALAKKYL